MDGSGTEGELEEAGPWAIMAFTELPPPAGPPALPVLLPPLPAPPALLLLFPVLLLPVFWEPPLLAGELLPPPPPPPNIDPMA